jgi:hypothetical protein
MIESELIEANAKYRADVVRARAIAKQEMNARITELTHDSLLELSKIVHNAHSNGTPKATINAILGVYSNAAQAKPIWDAFTPERLTDLRTRSQQADSGDSIPGTQAHRLGTDVIVSLGEDMPEVIVVAPRLFHEESGDSWVVWDVPSPMDLGDDYSVVYQAVYQFLVNEEANSGDGTS